MCSRNGGPMDAGTVNVSVYWLGGPVVRRYCFGPKSSCSGVLWAWDDRRSPSPMERQSTAKTTVRGWSRWEPRSTWASDRWSTVCDGSSQESQEPLVYRCEVIHEGIGLQSLQM